MLTKKSKIGFIGTGFVGGAYASYYEKKGFNIVRYSLDNEYKKNKNLIEFCDLVYICVPTPTTPKGFDDSILKKVLALVGDEKIALIKSTVLPNTTAKMQKKYPNKYILFSPEFLTEKTADYDIANPARNIIGYPTEREFKKCGEVMTILPIAPYENIVKAEEAEMIKYGGNCWFYFKVVFINILYDLCEKLGIDYEVVKNGMAADKRIGRSHLDAVHNGGRGAGGSCFLKDFEAFRRLCKTEVGDKLSNSVLQSLVDKNLKLLEDTDKSQNLVKDIYG